MAGAVIAVRFCLYLDLMLLFGLAAFGVYGLHGAERMQRKALPLAATLLGTAGAGIALSVFGMFALAATMEGKAITQLDPTTLTMLISETSVGTAFLVRLAALLLAGAAALLHRRTLAAVAAGAALASLAWSGHGAADEGMIGWLHLGADALHLLAGAIWVGALAALLMLVFRAPAGEEHLRLAYDALAGFSLTGTLVVATLVGTGAVNLLAIAREAGPGNVLGSVYGQLLMVKLILFAAMLALAASNRFRLVPRFAAAMTAGNHQGALGALRISLTLEIGCAIAILALVAWLGTLDPASGAM